MSWSCRHSPIVTYLSYLSSVKLNHGFDSLHFRFQRSIFYNKAYFGQNAWQLRWFTFSIEKITSVPNSCDPQHHRMRYPRFEAIEIDDKHLIIKIINPVEGKRDYFLMAPSKQIFVKVIEKMEVSSDKLF